MLKLPLPFPLPRDFFLEKHRKSIEHHRISREARTIMDFLSDSIRILDHPTTTTTAAAAATAATTSTNKEQTIKVDHRRGASIYIYIYILFIPFIHNCKELAKLCYLLAENLRNTCENLSHIRQKAIPYKTPYKDLSIKPITNKYHDEQSSHNDDHTVRS